MGSPNRLTATPQSIIIAPQSLLCTLTNRLINTMMTNSIDQFDRITRTVAPSLPGIISPGAKPILQSEP